MFKKKRKFKRNSIEEKCKHAFDTMLNFICRYEDDKDIKHLRNPKYKYYSGYYDCISGFVNKMETDKNYVAGVIKAEKDKKIAFKKKL